MKARHTTAIASPLPKQEFRFSYGLGAIVVTPPPHQCTSWPHGNVQQCHGSCCCLSSIIIAFKPSNLLINVNVHLVVNVFQRHVKLPSMDCLISCDSIFCNTMMNCLKGVVMFRQLAQGIIVESRDQESIIHKYIQPNLAIVKRLKHLFIFLKIVVIFGDLKFF